MARRLLDMPGLRAITWTRAGTAVIVATVLAAGAAYIDFADLTSLSPGAGERLASGGKSVERLTFVSDDEPTRHVRIADTLAMFALPQADARTWTASTWTESSRTDSTRAEKTSAERPATPSAQTIELPPRPRSAAALPRMVSQEAEAGRRTVVPAKMRGAAPSTLAMSGPVEPRVLREPRPFETAESGQVEILGVSLPGTQYLPDRQDARRAFTVVGSGATALGGRTVDVVTGTAGIVTSTASGVGTSLSTLGKSAAEAIGWR